jgi:hypothetical protein
MIVLIVGMEIQASNSPVSSNGPMNSSDTTTVLSHVPAQLRRNPARLTTSKQRRTRMSTSTIMSSSPWNCTGRTTGILPPDMAVHRSSTDRLVVQLIALLQLVSRGKAGVLLDGGRRRTMESCLRRCLTTSTTDATTDEGERPHAHESHADPNACDWVLRYLDFY